MKEYKLNNLKNILKDMRSILVAYSGGVDSTFLIKVAKDTGVRILAVTANSPVFPEWELEFAELTAKELNIPYIVINSDELKLKEFRENPTNRCYYCKKDLFLKLKEIAKTENIYCVVDGSHLDDTTDYRPGVKALQELGIRSPLKEAEFTKAEIRLLSKNMGLKNWDKPQNACLASRIPYGEEITDEKLKMISEAEKFLIDLGIKVVRVRYHNDIARIEVGDKYLNSFNTEDFRVRVAKKLKEIGYKYITVDLECYRQGSMNLLIS